MDVQSSKAMLVDTHAHLSDERLAEDLPGVIQRAWSSKVGQVVAPGTNLEDSRVVCGLASTHSGIFAAVAIHPNTVSAAESEDWQGIVELSESAEVVAIGETGLDLYWKKTPFADQTRRFQQHLDLAADRGKAVIIHCRDCYPEMIRHLEEQKRPITGVLHSFSGTWDDAQALLDIGLHISFAGPVTFTNKGLDELRDVAARVPLNRLLVETDSPYLSPHPFRGKTNEPARISFTAARIAELRGLTLNGLAGATTANAQALFRLPADRCLSPGQD